MVLVLLSNKWRSGGDPTKVSGALLSHLRPLSLPFTETCVRAEQRRGDNALSAGRGDARWPQRARKRCVFVPSRPETVPGIIC